MRNDFIFIPHFLLILICHCEVDSIIIKNRKSAAAIFDFVIMNNYLKNKLYLFLLMFCSCASRQVKIKTPIDLFFLSHEYKYYVEKTKIPARILDTLMNEQTLIGDANDSESINLTDLHLKSSSLGSSPFEFNSRLNFILVSDSLCLLSYKKGGVASYEVVEFFKYKGEFNRTTIPTTSNVSDTTELKKYLNIK